MDTMSVATYMSEFGDCNELFDAYDMIDEMESCQFSSWMGEFDRQIGFLPDKSFLITIDDVRLIGAVIKGTPLIGADVSDEMFADENITPTVDMSTGTDGNAESEESSTDAQIVIDISENNPGSSEIDPICVE